MTANQEMTYPQTTISHFNKLAWVYDRILTPLSCLDPKETMHNTSWIPNHMIKKHALRNQTYTWVYDYMTLNGWRYPEY